MNKLFRFSFITMLMITVLASCSKDDDVNVIEPVAATINANFGEEFDNKSIENIEVKLESVGGTDSYTANTTTEGKASFDAVNPGTYNVKATIQFTKEKYEEFFGIPTSEDVVNFSGVVEGVSINLDVNEHTVSLKTSRIGNLLFKQIFYAGSSLFDGAGFRDMFFEIYNNSNEVIYADNLYFGQVYGRTTTSVKEYTLANGQFDWSKSIGQTKGAGSNTNYTYADHVFKIPGTGNQYPINPGESIVVAATAINHKEPLVVGDQTYSVNDPSLTVDLSGADFEINMVNYLNSIGKTPLDSDVDNPAVPNLDVVFHTNAKDLILDPLGRDSFIIFSTDEIESFDKLPTPQTTEIVEGTKRYIQIPNSAIIDGVETNKPDPTSRSPRRLDTSVDGGVASVPLGHYSSQAIIRKVAKTFGDRKVLQDTNNSENDFEVVNVPVPGAWK
ncbi:DUF4876 domain-containing protein [Aureivirga sp. CE67]|uniref:DUF4876 domain-containing protein n=1 Tax=Aureivirga sp. CE67 TaxID=1788983 RepID=UPI0018CBA4B9|nr:DUF4876 domain-containing protein [Aureivirga sp. CE67]